MFHLPGGSGEGSMSASFYAPNFEEVEEAYRFVPVRLYVTPFVGCKLELRT